MNVTSGKSRKFAQLASSIGLAACLSTGPLCAAVEAQDAPSEAESEKAREIAAMHAEKFYGMAMKLNKDVAQAVSLVKSVLDQDPFAFVATLMDLLGVGANGVPPDITVLKAKMEIVAELQKLRGEELSGRAGALVDRFSYFLEFPESMTSEERLAEYLDDARDLLGELDAIMRNGDPARAEFVYHLAPTYNTVVSSLIFGLKLDKAPQASIDKVYSAAIDVNGSLVSDGDNYGGYLYRVAQMKAGPIGCYAYEEIPNTPAGGGGTVTVLTASRMDLVDGWVGVPSPNPADLAQPIYYCDDPRAATLEHARFDADPIVYLVRRAATDQVLALW